jgi:dienelactone hydrolase
VLGHGPPKLIEDGKELPAIVISPQTATDWSASITTTFVSYLLNHYDVDPDRVYVTGLGIGGEGTWLYASDHADTVAAIVPIAGAASGTSLRETPIWSFYNHTDPTLPGDSLAGIEDALEQLTGARPEPVPGYTGYFNGLSWRWRMGQAAPGADENPTFTVHENTGPDAWTAAYDNQAMWSWLFAQSRASTGDGSIVFKQVFQCPILDCDDPDRPDLSEFNDIGVQPNGGYFSIDQGRLQLVRTASTATDRNAAITRWTDLAGPPAVLHAAFDLGVSGWTASPYQAGAMVLTFGNLTGPVRLDAGDVAAGTFQTIAVKGKGPGQLALVAAGVESAPLAADGTLHHVEVFLNKSGAAASYRAPDGALRSLQDSGVALWVNGAAVVMSAAANSGADSALTDFRIRWATGDNGTWLLDNFLFKRALPQ